MVKQNFMKVLIIEDYVAISSALVKFLKLNSINADTAGDGRSGLAMIRASKYDVILLDLAMPEFSGHDLIEELIKTGEIKDLKIIINSASTFSTEDKESFIKKGIKLVLEKPVDPDLLVAKIKEFASK